MTTATSRTTSRWKLDLYITVEFHNYPDLFSSWFIICCSASSKDESNSALWLAAWAGKMELSCPFGTTRRVPQEMFSRKPYNKSFIDQACSIKMAGYWPSSFFACLWTETENSQINWERGQYPAILIEKAWSTTHIKNPLKLIICMQRTATKYTTFYNERVIPLVYRCGLLKLPSLPTRSTALSNPSTTGMIKKNQIPFKLYYIHGRTRKKELRATIIA